MSFLDERQQKLVLDLMGQRVSKDEFCHRFPVAPGAAAKLGLDILQHAIAERDADGVEFGLHVGFVFGFSAEHLDALHALATADWHERHEDVVEALEQLLQLGAKVSADVLYRTALTPFPYRDYDEAESLGVKCIWALRHLGTADAVQRLRELAASENAILAQSAADRLQGMGAG